MRRGHRPLLLISRKKVDADASAKYGELEFETVPAIAKPPTHSPRMLPFLWRMWRTIGQSKRLLKAREAEVVIGMGGFTSLPPVFAGHRMGLVTAMHDSNALPGKSNRLGSRWCTVVLLGMEAALRFFPKSEVEVTGTPVRSEFRDLPSKEAARAKFGLEPGKPVVLSFGGSQGAKKLNTVVAEASGILGEGVQWLQIAGRADENRMKELVGKKSGHAVLGFCDDMPSAYAASELVISRSGGASLTELSFLGLPAILVPYPFAADDHQTRNAESFERAGAAVLSPQHDLDGSRLAAIIGELLGAPGRLQAMAAAMRGLSVDDSAARICDVLCRKDD